MVGWHHQFNVHELGQNPGDGEGWGGLGMLQSMGLKRVRHNLQANNNKCTYMHIHITESLCCAVAANTTL